MQTALQQRFTAEDYLAWEETQVEKHEFVAGEVFAMTGARHTLPRLCYGHEIAH